MAKAKFNLRYAAGVQYSVAELPYNLIKIMH